MKKLLILALLALPLSLHAQVSNPAVIKVASAPSGACATSSPGQLVTPDGTIYTCQFGAWAQVSGGGGGGGATLPFPGIVFGTSATGGRVALPADIANLITSQTGCSTAGFVWVPASNTCVANGSDLLPSNNTWTGTNLFSTTFQVGDSNGTAGLPLQGIHEGLISGTEVTLLSGLTNIFGGTLATPTGSPVPSGTLQFISTFGNGATTVQHQWGFQDIPSSGTNPNFNLNITPSVGSGTGTNTVTINANGQFLSSTAATSGVPTNSPCLNFTGAFFTTSSQTDDWCIQNTPNTALLSGGLTFIYTGSANPVVQMPNLRATSLGSSTLAVGVGSQGLSVQPSFNSINGITLFSLGTTATSSGNVNSNSPEWLGSFWNGSSAQGDGWQVTDVVGSGTNPTSNLTYTHVGPSTGTATISMPAISVNGSPVCTSATGCNSAGSAPYTGLVATRTLEANTFNTSNTWIMNCTYHIARQFIPANSLQVVWQNMYVPNNTNIETSTISNATYKASIEYPIGSNSGANGCPTGGTIAGTCTFSGVTQPSIAPLADAIANSCPHAAIPNGAAFRVRMLYVNPSGIPLEMATNIIPQREGNLFGTGTPNDLTAGGAVAGATSVMYSPAAIIGTTTLPTVAIVGDSRSICQGDLISNVNVGDCGEIARWIGPHFAYTNLGVFGTTVQTALTNYTNRLRIVAFASHVIDEYGVNDIYANNRTANQVSTDRTSMATLLGKPTYGTTLPPETTSSLILTAAGAASGGSTVYTGTFPNMGNNACIGLDFNIAGFTNAGNNGTGLVCTASTTTTLTLTNASGIAETHAGTATDLWASTLNQQTKTNFAALATFNGLARAGILGESNVFDIDNVVDPLNIGMFPVSKITGASIGTANFGTVDGTHESPGMYLIEQQQMSAFASWITRR
jgi:hypothetical protein